VTQSEIITLEYQSVGPGRYLPRWARIIFAVATVPAMAVVWLPYTWHVSPWDVLWAVVTKTASLRSDEWAIVQLAAPFWLAVPVWSWKLRLAIQERSSAVERRVLAVLAIAAMLCTAGFVMRGVVQGMETWRPLEWMMVVCSALAGTAMLAVTWWLRRRRVPREWVTTVLLYAAYLANGTLCGFAFSDRPDIGWGVSLCAMAAMLAEVGVYTVWAVIRKPTSVG
jgi:hypothetical protein